MKKIKRILLILVAIVALLFVNNNYLKRTDVVIKADGIGYYDYLPSIFIHKDFNRKNLQIHDDSTKHERILNVSNDFYVDFKKHKVNKYPVGTALLQTPFFLASYLYASLQQNNIIGYEMVFQKGIMISTFFYLVVGLIFLFKLLQLYNIPKYLNLFVLFIAVFGTNILYYTFYESSFSHVYSFSLICGLFYAVKSYSISLNKKQFYYACLFLGLIILTRQINVFVLFFVPFLFDSFKHFKNCLSRLFENKAKTFIIGIILVMLIFSIQLIAWYFQTGNWILYSYQNEHFNFLNPQIINFLFSYKKGLFIYTPILFICFTCLSVYYVFKKDVYHLLTWILPFLILTYVLSSWWSWFYGCSLGMRVFIDFYVIFFIPLALVLKHSQKYFQILLVSLSLLTVPYSLVLIYQYKHFIIHWINMDKKMFWTTFLNYQNVYKGYVWLEKETKNLKPLKKIRIDERKILPKTSSKIFIDSIPKNSDLKYIKLKLKSQFSPKNASAFELKIYEAGEKNYCFSHYFYLFHFSDYQFPNKKQGEYLIKFDKTLPNSKLFLQLYFTNNQEKNTLSDIEISYF